MCRICSVTLDNHNQLQKRSHLPKFNKVTMKELLKDVCCSACQHICSLLYRTVMNQFKCDLAIARPNPSISLSTLLMFFEIHLWNILCFKSLNAAGKSAEANWSSGLWIEKLPFVFQQWLYLNNSCIHALKQIIFALWIKAVIYRERLDSNRIVARTVYLSWVW